MHSSDSTNNQMVTLYHGSKSGVEGVIAPVSRERCDFGKGIALADEICRKYRREGRFFDEILEAEAE